MKRYPLVVFSLVVVLTACSPIAILPESTETAEGPAYLPAPTETRENREYTQVYTDPAGQYRVSFPADWQPGNEEGSFSGPDGTFHTGYLPEMAFMDHAYRACERLADTPQGPARKVIFSPLQNLDSCTLMPFPEMSTDLIRVVVSNPTGQPEQRFFYLEADQGHVESIIATLQLSNPPTQQKTYSYPSGPMRTEDEAFWEKTASLPDELTVEDYAVADAAVESPMDLEFGRKIPAEVYQKREAWRGGFIERKLASNNELLQPFSYNIKAKQDSAMDLYQLYRKDELILDNIDAFKPVSVSASGKDFAMVAEIWNGSDRLVRKDSLEEWDMGDSLFIPPVFSAEDLLRLRWVPERTQVQVISGEEQIYAFPATFLVSSPVKGLWSWQGHWLMEVDGFLIQDGVNLNEKLGYEEIFGWEILNGKPFYYFRKGPRVGISYDGKILPVYYDDIFHYHCCGPAGYNAAGNDDMVWFYALRGGEWYYVEIGAYS